jgi:tellurite resistance protein TerC
MPTVGTPLLWIGFTAMVVLLLFVDLAVFHRKAHRIRIAEAVAWSVVWIVLAVGFGVGIYVGFGREPALEFFAGYLIEKALSVDNLFVFLVIFSYFSVPPALQHRVLYWGILGAMVMRGIFVIAGAALIHRFHALIYVFGGFLVVTGIKLFVRRDAELHPEDNRLFKWFHRVIPATADYRDARFTVVEHGRRLATPLLLVLLAIEASDILFAVDSVPAIFGVTRDPFLVYTSNIFAILGLRALYFVLAGAMERFRYLKVGLALVLVFVGAKMIGSSVVHVPIGVSLGVVAALLAGAVVASVVRPGAASAPPPAPARP